VRLNLGYNRNLISVYNRYLISLLSVPTPASVETIFYSIIKLSSCGWHVRFTHCWGIFLLLFTLSHLQEKGLNYIFKVHFLLYLIVLCKRALSVIKSLRPCISISWANCVFSISRLLFTISFLSIGSVF